MKSIIISGLIGGIISIALCTYVSTKVRNTNKDGELKFGWFLVAVAWGCLAFVILSIYAFFYDDDAWSKPGELFSIIGIFIGFAAGAIYLFGEYFKVRGTFDEEGISFHTPWTGSKKEKWEDLKSIKFNSFTNWYVLTFNSGQRIRLSTLLSGHGSVLDLLRRKGHEF